MEPPFRLRDLSSMAGKVLGPSSSSRTALPGTELVPAARSMPGRRSMISAQRVAVTPFRAPAIRS
jgi:hypothetical protein